MSYGQTGKDVERDECWEEFIRVAIGARGHVDHNKDSLKETMNLKNSQRPLVDAQGSLPTAAPAKPLTCVSVLMAFSKANTACKNVRKAIRVFAFSSSISTSDILQSKMLNFNGNQPVAARK